MDGKCLPYPTLKRSGIRISCLLPCYRETRELDCVLSTFSPKNFRNQDDSISFEKCLELFFVVDGQDMSDVDSPTMNILKQRLGVNCEKKYFYDGLHCLGYFYKGKVGLMRYVVIVKGPLLRRGKRYSILLLYNLIMERERLFGWSPEYVMNVDADTFCPGHSMLETVRFMDKMPRSVGAVQPKLYSADMDIETNGLRDSTLMFSYFFDYMLYKKQSALSFFSWADMLFGPVVLFRYEAVKRIYPQVKQPIPHWNMWAHHGKYFSDDLYLSSLLLCNGYSTKIVPHVVAYPHISTTPEEQLEQMRRWLNTDLTIGITMKVPSLMRRKPWMLPLYIPLLMFLTLPYSTALQIYTLQLNLESIGFSTQYAFCFMTLLTLLFGVLCFGRSWKEKWEVFLLRVLWVCGIGLSLGHYKVILDSAMRSFPVGFVSVACLLSMVILILQHAPLRCLPTHLLSLVAYIAHPYQQFFYVINAICNLHVAKWGTRENTNDDDYLALEHAVERAVQGTDATRRKKHSDIISPIDLADVQGGCAEPASALHYVDTILTYVPTSTWVSLDVDVMIGNMLMYFSCCGLMTTILFLVYCMRYFSIESTVLLYIGLVLYSNVFCFLFIALEWLHLHYGEKIIPKWTQFDKRHGERWWSGTWDVLKVPLCKSE